MLKTSLNAEDGSAAPSAAGDRDSSAAAPDAASGSAAPAYVERFISFPEAVCVLGTDGRFIDVNDAAAAMYGHPRTCFIGKTCGTVTAGGLNDPAAMVGVFEKALAGEPQSLEFWGKPANGEQSPQDLRLTSTTWGGQPALIAVARDVTRQKRAEAQVCRLNRLYAVLSATNEFIVRCHDANTLFGEACRIAVEVGGFCMAWIGLTNPASEEIKPVAHSGQAGDYLEHLHVARTGNERGNGPTGEALRQGEYRVCNDIAKERALSASINGIAMANLDGDLSYVNQAFLELWGYDSEDEVLGRSILEVWNSPKQAGEAMAQLVAQGILRGDLTGRRKNGSTFVTQVSANLVTDPHGKPVCMQGAFIDISERREDEAMVQWDREQQATLRGMLEAVLKGGTLEETLDYCLRQLLAVSWLSLLPKGGIFLMEENRQTLRLTVSRDLAKEIMSLCAQVPLGKCHCGRAAATRQMQFSSCVDERHEISFPGMAEHGHYNMPLISEGEVLGVTVLYRSGSAGPDAKTAQFAAPRCLVLPADVEVDRGVRLLAGGNLESPQERRVVP